MLKAPLKKLRVGWFSFTCSEDSTIVLTEILNDYYLKWKNLIDFRYIRVLKQKNILGELDVAFVEGAISSKTQEEKLKEIRKKAKILIAVGSCAILGVPAGQRNLFEREKIDEILPILEKFSYKGRVQRLDEIVKVEDQIPGCPMAEKEFLELLNKYLKRFRII